ncbi:MAG: iron-sulfur cluster assembly scaffold protein [Deltaproteobacteria bacterium]|nr:iron-sulfur cluster assembly scaffold protein [Deltaproteobacteria bacterium]
MHGSIAALVSAVALRGGYFRAKVWGREITAVCMKDQGCVLPRSRRSVHDYFAKGCSRRRDALPYRGDLVEGSSRLRARFSFRLTDGARGSPRDGPLIEEASFDATTCATLIALCAFLAEWMEGSVPDAAFSVSAGDLLTCFPRNSSSKHDRADLAVEALRAAARGIMNHQTIERSANA